MVQSPSKLSVGQEKLLEMQVDEKPPVTIGEVLPNGGVVLAYKWRPHTEGEEIGQHGIVLCLLSGNYHPFVVWRFVKRTRDNHVLLLNGDYWDTVINAVMSYKARIKNL